MDSLLQFFGPTVPRVNDIPYDKDMEYAANSDDAGTYLIDLAWPNYRRTVPSKTTQTQEEVQTLAPNAEAELDNDFTHTNTFDIASIDDDDDNWNIRSDDEEKDHVYYVPPGAYRSYVLESDKGDTECKNEKRNNDDGVQDVPIGFDIASPNELDNLGEDEDEWNIRGDDEEKDFVYQMPSDAYRSYELGSWNRETKEDDEKTGCRNDNNGKVAGSNDLIESCAEEPEQERNLSVGDTEDDFEEYLDLTTAQSMATRPRVVPTENVSRWDLCRVCRDFHDAKNERSKNSGARLVQKLMVWRKKSHRQTCARCGYGIDRRSFLPRIFGVGKNADGIY